MNSAKVESYDQVIVGAGLFGLHVADVEIKKNKKILLVEQDPAPFQRASLINQARVHLGYHYPRSMTTGLPSVEHFKRFCEEFSFSILGDIRKIYAISNRNSLTTFRRFEAFCRHIQIPLSQINPSEFFRTSSVSAAYETAEVVFDGAAIGKYLFDKIHAAAQFRSVFNCSIQTAKKVNDEYFITLTSGETLTCKRLINTTYSGINQIQQQFQQPPLDLKYELTELVLGQVPERFRKVGITIMDGPFFSLMPWGDGTYHSLTAVQYTPRKTSLDILPTFNCMDQRAECSPARIQICNECEFKPKSAQDLMVQVAKKYLIDEFIFSPQRSSFTVKVLLKRSEIDDSRPTVIEQSSSAPDFVSILSGKINTIYEYEKYFHREAP